MKTLIAGFLIILSLDLKAGENIYNTNISYAGFDPFSIPFPLALDFKNQFYYGAPFESLNVTGANLYPTLVVSPVKDKQVISLSKTADLEKDNKLVLANPEDGYLYINKKKLEIGVGLALTTNTAPEVIGSLMPYYGSERSELRLVDSKDKKYLKDLKPLDLPKDRESFDAWKVGEQLSYFKKGGVIFYPTVGVSIARAGAGFSAEGVWKVVLSKLSIDELLVEVKRYKLKSLKAGASAIAPSIGLMKYWKFDNEFSFVFDLKESKSFKVMETLLGGNIKKAQNLADSNKDDFVSYLKNNKRNTTGRNFKLKFSIPALFTASFTLNEETQKELIFKPLNDLQSIIYSGQNARVASTSGVLSRDYTKYIAFDAKVTKNSNISTPNEVDTFAGAHYRYLFQRDKMDAKFLNKQIHKLYKKVGFKNQINLTAPTDKKFGSLKLKVDLLYYPSGVLKLMGQEEYTKDELLNLAYKKIDNYFLNNEKAKYLCGWVEKLNACKKSYKLLTKIRIKRASKYLKKMKTQWVSKNHQDFAKSFSRLGKNLTKNLFLTDLLLDIYGRDNIKGKYSVQGSDIAAYEKALII
jgi:hypothetical protein